MKKSKSAGPTITRDLTPERTACAHCGRPMWADYANRRTLHTLAGVTRRTLTIRRCRNTTCTAHKKPYRPEAEGAFALPRHEFGLDVIALVGRLRYAEHRSVPEIHAHRVGRQVSVSERTVTNLLDRYDELLAVARADDRRLRKVLVPQEKVILALDGLQPDVGHEVLWVLRDVLGGEILLAKSLLSARQQDLVELLSAVKASCPVPVVGIVSDGQHAIRKAVAKVFPGVPHQLCQFHDRREAARPIYEADRHAKKELKKTVRGVRNVERQAEGRAGPEAEVVRGYGSAVRSALTDDGRPPLDASGLKLHGRLSAVAASLGRLEAQGGFRPVEMAQGDDRSGPVGDGGDVAADPPGVRVGASCGSRPGFGEDRRLRDPGATGRPVGRDDDASGGRRRVGRCGRSLREGKQELLAGSVRVLRDAGPAADQQRPGAGVRESPVPRASGDGSTGCESGVGAAGRGQVGGRAGDTQSGGDDRGTGRCRSCGVEASAVRVGNAA